MKTFLEVFTHVTSQLEQNDIPYMIVGSMAAMVYGEPRLTRDIDIVLNIHPVDSHKLTHLFPMASYYCPPPEVLKAEITHRGQFNLIHQETQIKIDIMIRKNTDHAVTEFARRQKVSFWEDFGAYLAQPEDIILKKLSYYREGGSAKHLTDIRGILANMAIDKEYLQKWIEELNLQKVYEEI